MRKRFIAMGSDVQSASQDKTYMRDRRAVRIAALAVVVALAALYASSDGVNPWLTGLIAGLLLAASIPFFDRLRGWSAERTL